MTFHLLYTEVNMISLVLIIILVFKARNFKQLKGYTQYVRALFFLVIFIFSDVFSYLMLANILPKVNWLVLILKSFYFLSTAFQGYYWLLYFECRGNTNIAKDQRLQYGLFSLVIFQTIMQIANLHHGFFFHMTENGTYDRGSLFFIQYAFCYFYIAFAIARALYSALFKSNYFDKSYIVTLAVFPILPALSGLIQYLNARLPVTCVCLTISALLLYMDDVESLTFVDPLTGLNNRRNFMRLLSQKMKGENGLDQLYLLMIDVDYFKTINDTYGHAEGDNALVCISNALTRAALTLKKKAYVGRFGGDEFIAIVDLEDNEPIADFVSTIQESLKKEHEKLHAPFDISISIGYARFDPDFKMVNDFISAADEKLYEVKEERHRQLNRK